MELFHVMNRAVEGRTIFVDTQDHARFVHDLYEFNTMHPAQQTARKVSAPDTVSRTYEKQKIVDIHGWVLNKNHYHLLLSERVEGGISLFLRKLNVGYAKYFNEKYGRKGTLFQGRTKKILIERQAQFLYILHYIHLNALDQVKGSEGWRIRDKESIQNRRKALEYLDTYRWSSYIDYCGKHNFPSILTTSLFKNADVFYEYRKSVDEYLEEIEMEKLSGLILE